LKKYVLRPDLIILLGVYPVDKLVGISSAVNCAPRKRSAQFGESRAVWSERSAHCSRSKVLRVPEAFTLAMARNVIRFNWRCVHSNEKCKNYDAERSPSVCQNQTALQSGRRLSRKIFELCSTWRSSNTIGFWHGEERKKGSLGL